MMTPSALLHIMDETWPAAAYQGIGPWQIRDGAGGGKRVCAASVDGPWAPQDIASAAAAMQALGQQPLFLLRRGEDDLDAALALLDYEIVDPVTAYSALLETDFAPNDRCIAHWPPMENALNLWRSAGIGPARIAVMRRAQGPKTAILAQSGGADAGVCFVAMSGDAAMVHALEVAVPHRRQGSAQMLLQVASRWAIEQGAAKLCLVVTTANAPARALYEKFGMQNVGAYHYRLLRQNV